MKIIKTHVLVKSLKARLDYLCKDWETHITYVNLLLSTKRLNPGGGQNVTVTNLRDHITAWKLNIKQ